jgi:hypothetical protein
VHEKNATFERKHYLNTIMIKNILLAYSVIILFQDEQLMYPSSLENEKFMVALVNCKPKGCVSYDLLPDDSVLWEITRAYKYE